MVWFWFWFLFLPILLSIILNASWVFKNFSEFIVCNTKCMIKGILYRVCSFSLCYRTVQHSLVVKMCVKQHKQKSYLQREGSDVASPYHNTRTPTMQPLQKTERLIHLQHKQAVPRDLPKTLKYRSTQRIHHNYS